MCIRDRIASLVRILSLFGFNSMPPEDGVGDRVQVAADEEPRSVFESPSVKRVFVAVSAPADPVSYTHLDVYKRQVVDRIALDVVVKLGADANDKRLAVQGARVGEVERIERFRDRRQASTRHILSLIHI